MCSQMFVTLSVVFFLLKCVVDTFLSVKSPQEAGPTPYLNSTNHCVQDLPSIEYTVSDANVHSIVAAYKMFLMLFFCLILSSTLY